MSKSGCTKECGSVFHMTGGRHRTDCALHRYDKICEEKSMEIAELERKIKNLTDVISVLHSDSKEAVDRLDKQSNRIVELEDELKNKCKMIGALTIANNELENGDYNELERKIEILEESNHNFEILLKEANAAIVWMTKNVENTVAHDIFYGWNHALGDYDDHKQTIKRALKDE